MEKNTVEYVWICSWRFVDTGKEHHFWVHPYIAYTHDQFELALEAIRDASDNFGPVTDIDYVQTNLGGFTDEEERWYWQADYEENNRPYCKVTDTGKEFCA